MIGKTIGSYRVVDRIGEGGMGVVYCAEHSTLDKQAAVKVLHPELSSSRELAERFINEAKSAARIRHPGIVEILDIGYHQKLAVYFILMELLEGESLAARLRRVGALSEVTALSFIRQAAGALGAAHDKHIVHRDLKPDNLFLVSDPEIDGGERIKILDFGIAKLMENQIVSNTASGALLGSPPYMSPEQCLGAADVDHRTDLYSLGIILFRMLCGRRPFVKKTAGEYIVAHTSEPPPPIQQLNPQVSPAVAAIVTRLMAKRVAERFQSTAALIAAIDEVMPPTRLSGSSPLVSSSSVWMLQSSDVFGAASAGRASAAPRRRLWLGAALVACAAAVGGGVAYNRSVKPTAATELPAAARSAHEPRRVDEPVSEKLAQLDDIPPPTISHRALASAAPMPFIAVEAGSYMRGAPGSDGDARAVEGPRHRVTVGRFELSQYEVTQKQWQVVMGVNPSDCAFGCGDDMPVQNVSWVQAIEFLNRLSEIEQVTPCYAIADDGVTWDHSCDGYRLPTEAEWEYAARAGTSTPYSFGADPALAAAHAWFKSSADGKVHPVGGLRANPWGFYDLHGNAWEWVWDRYGSYSNVPLENPTGPTQGERRTLRGGCFLSPTADLRSTYRAQVEPDVSYEYFSLRVARGRIVPAP
ncbi:MAG: hypothetical protein Tsb0020_41560 [Haliangiales bacterium]